MNRQRLLIMGLAIALCLGVGGIGSAARRAPRGFIQLVTLGLTSPPKTTGPCPATIKFVAGFEGSAPKEIVGKKVTVKYAIVRSDQGKQEGTKTPTVSLLNTTQGPVGYFKEVWDYTWTIGGPGKSESFSEWVMLKTLSPTERESLKAEFQVVCTRK